MRLTYKCISLINAEIYSYITKQKKKKKTKEEITLPGLRIKFAQNENVFY